MHEINIARNSGSEHWNAPGDDDAPLLLRFPRCTEPLRMGEINHIDGHSDAEPVSLRISGQH